MTVISRQRGADSSRQTRRRAAVGRGQWAVTGAWLACLLLTVVDAPLAAQGQPQRDAPAPAAIHYGKWAAAAAAAGFTALGIRRHNQADDDYRALADYCRVQSTCTLGSDGHYTDPVAEARYLRVSHGDRMARAWLVSGQAALVGSVVLFVLELKRDRGPRNIPYSGLVIEPGPLGTRFGLRIPVR